ncbi:hypothetical protein H0A36_17870 [Endozoicomonas sp. SM1973]|uniref:Uncharacterized protein n=1 Tax=Spartinivicinus marinus TaxID=2994442 RepID=A0A853IJR4_9GAMM|nr:hypothetical protein [Spartinivicinus marinus]MCX4025986.1 hypothetical protein [Spartinivicinus marinus]NYZ67886.1 hypothetical protein [Spartinivicinus marinus]
MKKLFIEVFGILLGMLSVVYTVSIIHMDMRQAYYQETGILPEMDPRLNVTIAVFLAVFALIAVGLTELVRLWVFESRMLEFKAAVLFGLISVSFIPCMFFIPELGWFGLLGVQIVCMGLFYYFLRRFCIEKPLSKLVK